MEVREQLHSGDAFSRGVRESDILCFHGGRSDGRLFPRGPEYGTIVNHDDDPRDRSPIVAIVSPVSVSINTGVQVGSSSECESKVFGVVQISEKMTRCFDVGNRGILVELREFVRCKRDVWTCDDRYVVDGACNLLILGGICAFIPWCRLDERKRMVKRRSSGPCILHLESGDHTFDVAALIYGDGGRRGSIDRS